MQVKVYDFRLLTSEARLIA